MPNRDPKTIDGKRRMPSGSERMGPKGRIVNMSDKTIKWKRRVLGESDGVEGKGANIQQGS